MRAAAMALVVLGACASTENRAARWLDPAAVARDVGKEGLPAVVLEKSDRVVIYPAMGRFEYTEWQHHEVIEVLAEAGVDLAEKKIRFHDKAEIKEIRARSIDPDGTTHDLDPRDLMEQVDAEVEDTTFKTKVFRVPAVKVGSIIEFSFTIRFDFAVSQWTESVATWVPVRSYDVELLVGPRVRYALRTYNAPTSFQKSQEGDFTRFTWNLVNVPPVERDGYSPHWTVASPWFSYRTKQETYYGKGWDLVNDWADALHRDYHRLVPGSELLDEELPPPGAGCANLQCRLAAALAEVRAVPLRRVDSLGAARKLTEIRGSGWATSAERTLLLLDALRRAGVKARPAFATRPFTIQPDPQFPWTEAWNKLLVKVPAQGDLGDMWIDPVCDRCTPGELTAEAVGADAMVLQTDGKFERNDEVEVRHETVTGNVRTPEKTQLRHLVSLDASGTARVITEVETTGQRAIWQRARNPLKTPEDWKKSAEQLVRKRVDTGKVLVQKPPECRTELDDCTRRVEYELEGYATVTPDRILVPLKVLHDDWDDRFKENERASGIVIELPVHHDEELTLQIPEGYAVSELVTEHHAEGPAFLVDVDARTEGGNRVVIHRSVREKQGAWDVSTYDADQAALRPYWQARDQVLVLRRVGAGGR